MHKCCFWSFGKIIQKQVSIDTLVQFKTTNIKLRTIKLVDGVILKILRKIFEIISDLNRPNQENASRTSLFSLSVKISQNRFRNQKEQF